METSVWKDLGQSRNRIRNGTRTGRWPSVAPKTHRFYPLGFLRCFWTSVTGFGDNMMIREAMIKYHFDSSKVGSITRKGAQLKRLLLCYCDSSPYLRLVESTSWLGVTGSRKHQTLRRHLLQLVDLILCFTSSCLREG